MKKVLLYPGRYQPFASHHLEVFNKAVEKLKPDYSFIVSSDAKLDPKKRRWLTFKQKKSVADLFNVNNFICCKSPYAPREVVEYTKENIQDLVYIFLIGEKDMSVSPRFASLLRPGDIAYKKDKSLSYMQRYDYGQNNGFENAMDRGYIYVQENIKNSTGICSSTDLRDKIKNSSWKEFPDIIGLRSEPEMSELKSVHSMLRKSF
jgi:nicotinic acid mononucleotide adenylyltransferase